MENKYENLQKLNELLKNGVISNEEYETEKKKILGNAFTQLAIPKSKETSYSSIMHLSQFSNYILPPLGYIIPILMWASRKNESDSIDKNGKVILNWNLSLLIYSIAFLIILAVILFSFGGAGFISSLMSMSENMDSMSDEAVIGSVFGMFGTIFLAALPLIIFAILDFVFTIIGAIKAGNGEVWNYPLSIKFFKTLPQTSKEEF